MCQAELLTAVRARQHIAQPVKSKLTARAPLLGRIASTPGGLLDGVNRVVLHTAKNTLPSCLQCKCTPTGDSPKSASTCTTACYAELAGEALDAIFSIADATALEPAFAESAAASASSYASCTSVTVVAKSL